VKRWKGNWEIIPKIKDNNGTIFTDSTLKAKVLNSYYASIFCCDRNIPKIQLANAGETFIINTKVIRKRLSKIGRNKRAGPLAIVGQVECFCQYFLSIAI
jgi:hypothetical protein